MVGTHVPEQLRPFETFSSGDDLQQQRDFLHRYGYLVLKTALDKNLVLDARRAVLQQLKRLWNLIDTGKGALEQGFINLNDPVHPKGRGILLAGFTDITHLPEMRRLLEGPELSSLISNLSGESCSTLRTKWLRVMGINENTDEHADFYRFSHFNVAKRMLTCWIPLGSYTAHEGTLAICESTHHLISFDEFDEDQSDSKSELPSHFDLASSSCVWRTGDFQAGDLCIFDIRTIHASTKNQSECFRISVDSRWQPSSLIPENLVKGFITFNE